MSFPPLGRLSAGFWSMAIGIRVHSISSALVRSDTDVGRGGLGCSRRSSSSRALCGTLQFFHSNLTTPCLPGAAGFERRKIVMLEQDLGLLRPVKWDFHATAYKIILYDCALLSLCATVWLKNHIWVRWPGFHIHLAILCTLYSLFQVGCNLHGTDLYA